MAQKKAKSTHAKETPEVVPDQIPQLTFTEEEHKSLVDYMNFVSDYARFNNLDDKKMHERTVNNIKVVNVIKKIEAHIFEFKRKIKPIKQQGSQ